MASADAQARPRFAGLRRLEYFGLGLLAALIAPPASAGAWIAPEGGQVIATEVVGERGDETFLESQIYIEAPLSRRFAIVMQPWLEVAQTPQNRLTYRDETVLGLKGVAFRSEQHVVALQAGAVWRSMPDPNCSESGAELRALAGRSSESGAFFVNAETAFQTLGDCRRSKLDITLGFRRDERWLGLVEGFGYEADDGGRDLKAQFSLVRLFENGFGLQFGVRVPLENEVSPALVLALWREGRRGD